nr:GPI anchored serine-threonine rich family protein [Thermoflexibacter sp.]
MKKLILAYISLLFVLFTNQAYAQAITITSPNGGETLMVGTDYNISWSFMPTNPTQDVFTIELLLNNLPYSIIANNVAATNLPFIWRVPTTLPDRNDYRIRVSRTSNSSVNDISDANFGISGGRSIRINTPTNTTVLNRGANFNITWIATFADNFKIDLLQNGTVLQNIVGATTGNLYTWSVPAMLPIGNNYQIRISSVTDATVFAESNVFAVEQTMRVNSPNGGQAYAKGSMQTITWVTSSNLTVAENVKIELTNNGVVIQTIAASIPNSGTHNWTVPNVTDGGNYKIRVSLLSNANVVDESDDTFAIGFFVRVTSPARGEVWNRGSTYQIRWTTNVLALLRVELIVNGAVIRVVETGIPSTMVNNINWTVPNDLNNNDGYTIRVISLADANQQGSSEAFSIIAPPTIRVTSPQGGETWKKRETYDITWQSGASGNVKIDLLKNNVLAQVISNSTPNANGRFSWTIPANVLAGNDYRVRVNSLSINNLSGQSDANFTISEADSIRITNPVANANVIKGTDINITWTTNFAGNVVVELLRNATFYATISASTANNGRLTWKVPERVNDIPVESGAFYRIRIRTADNRISELSPLFSIADPTFQLSTPNGGEQFYKGFSYPIIWLSNIQGGVKIDLYNNNFTFIRTIAQEANGGRFDWVVPTDLIDGNFYSIRITSLTNATLIDDSGANFSILTGQIQVTNPRGGETWYGNGFTYPISWTNNTQRPVRVELWRGNALITNIANNVAANTTSFIIPNVPDGTDYRIRVSSIENTNLFVESNAIRILRPVLTLMSPRGGESFIQELTNRIEWTSNLPANELVKIDLYIGNVFNRVIASSVDNNNFHPWTIFTNVPLGTNYRIRVSLVNVPSIFSESPASFSIIRDNIPPVISDEVFPALFDGSNAAVSSIDPSFNVIDNLGTDGLRIICWYRSISNARSDMTGGWSQFNAVLEGNRYKGIIPKNAFDGEIGVEYYIEAIDRVGN